MNDMATLADMTRKGVPQRYRLTDWSEKRIPERMKATREAAEESLRRVNMPQLRFLDRSRFFSWETRR